MTWQTLKREERIKTQSDCCCDWCGRVIRRGDRYVYSSNIYEGNFVPWRVHTHCEEWANALFKAESWYYADGIPQYGLIEALEELNHE